LPIVLAIAVLTYMKAAAIGDTYKTTARVAKAHFAVRVESRDARQLLI
jgi:hypothetical protein